VILPPLVFPASVVGIINKYTHLATPQSLVLAKVTSAVFKGEWKPTSIFSVQTSVSVVSSGSKKRTSVGKIQMLGRLISFHPVFFNTQHNTLKCHSAKAATYLPTMFYTGPLKNLKASYLDNERFCEYIPFLTKAISEVLQHSTRQHS